MLKFLSSKRTKKGFSLAEVLVVVAIIGILLAVAIPNVLAYYRTLKLTELDDSARSIFMAAQNRMNALVNQGVDLTKLGTENTSIKAPTSGSAEVKIFSVSNVVTGDADKFHTIVPGGSIDSQLQNNNVVVEFDPSTGAVYAVWYWEKGDFNYTNDAYKNPGVEKPEDKDSRLPKMVGYYGGSTINRGEVGQMPIPEVNITNAEELRVDIKIPSMNESGTGINDKVFVDVFVDGKMIIAHQNLWPVGHTGTVILDTLDTTKYQSKPKYLTTGDTESWIAGNKFKNWEILNDDGTGFGKTLSEDGVVPGSDVTVTVKVYFEGTLADGKTLVPQSVSATVNSLFESIESNGPDTYTAKIAYGRHLQNLHAGYSEDITSGVGDNITKAKQTKDINFAATAKGSENPIYYWGSTYPDEKEKIEYGQDLILNLHGINNSNLTEYDGQDHEIRNMYVLTDSVAGGLFSMVMGGNYHNITVVNPHVHGEPDPASGKGSSVGAIIGMASGNVEIADCKVYFEYDETKDLEALGDKLKDLNLDNVEITKASNDISYVKDLLGVPFIAGSEENSSAGGLVGLSMDEISIHNSFCSIPVVGHTNAGGLVGLACNISINNSYSASFVYGYSFVGGLVGLASDVDEKVEIKDCYAAGEVMNGRPSSFVGAGLGNFVLKSGAVQVIANNYSAVKFVNATGEAKTGAGEEKQGTVYGTYSGDEPDDSNYNYYIADPDVTKGYGNKVGVSDPVPCGTKVTAEELLEKIESMAGWTAPAGASYTHPYRLLTKLAGLPDEYPYPMLKDTDGNVVPHYGDWVENNASGGLVNWEQYPASSTEKYGVWGNIYNETTGKFETINTLVKGNSETGTDLEYAVADGYGVLVKQDSEGNSTAPNVTISKSTGDVTKTLTTTIVKDIEFTGHSGMYDLYALDESVYDGTPTQYYTKITVDGTSFWYNPDFACEVILEDGSKSINENTAPLAKKEVGSVNGSDYKDAEANTVVIRTARQLANLSVYTNSTTLAAAKTWSYTQLLDIDYGEYSKVTTSFTTGTQGNPQLPATLINNSSGSVQSNVSCYVGNEFVIRHLYIGSKDSYAGLFGQTLYASISGVRLVNVNVSGAEADYVGGLVGSASGSEINNCGIYVEDEVSDGVDDKYVEFCITGKQSATGSNNFTGGLVGQFINGGSVEDSFAAVKVSGGYITGGFAGLTQATKITDCYSGGHTLGGAYIFNSTDKTANVTGKDQVGGFVGNPGAASFHGICYSTCSVCNNGTTGNAPGLFSGLDANSVFTTTDIMVYATGVAYNNAGNQINAKAETYLKTGASIPARNTTATTFKTAPYDDALFEKDGSVPDYNKPLAYPYETKLGEHHGDWVTFPMVANIEKYQGTTGTDPVYGVYAASLGVDASTPASPTTYSATINTLKSQEQLDKDGLTLVNDYYRVISPHELTGGALNFTLDNDTANTYSLELDNNQFTGGKIKVGDTEYYVYNFFVTKAIDVAASVKNYYHSIKLGNSTFFFNPHFGLEAFDVTAKVPSDLTKILEKPEAAGKDADGNVVKFKGSAGSETDTATGVVIRSARQLANIQEYTNYASDPDIATAAKGWTYEQLLDVDFDGYETELKGKMKADGTVDRLTPATLNSGKYYGHKNKISNLYIGGNSSVGLFGAVSGKSTIDGVRLVDVNVDGSHGLTTGGLVGALEGGTVSDCGIYVSGNSYDDFYNKFTVTGMGDVGGLIGAMSGGDVSSSFAAVKVSCTDGTSLSGFNAGGFAGKIAGGTITNCYAGGYVAEGSETYESTSVNVTGGGNVGGFVGSVVTSTDPFDGFSSINYSTASVGGPDMANVGNFAGSGTIDKTDTTLYALAKTFKADSTTTPGTTIYTETSARNESAYLVNPVEQTDKISAENTHKYNAKDNEYPYQTNLDEHYGDWIELVKGAYFDSLSSGSSPTLVWYSNGGTGANAINTLTGIEAKPGSGIVAVDDGYAFLSKRDLGSLTMGINGVSFTLEKESDTVGIGSETYYVYEVPIDALNSMPVDTYYYIVSVNGQFFTANFAFAGEIFDEKTETTALGVVKTKYNLPYVTASSTNGAVIRSARQLANLGLWTSRGEASGDIVRGRMYNQLLDIDYEKYTGKDSGGTSKLPAVGTAKETDGTPRYNHVPISLEGGGSGYNGREFEIRGLKPGMLLDQKNGSLVESGLFGRVKNSTIADVRVVNTRTVANGGDSAVANRPSSSGTSTSSLSEGYGIMTIAGGDEKYVLEAQSGVSAKIDKKEVGSEKAGTDDYFTLWWNKSGSIDASTKEFTDGYKTGFRYNFGGAAAKDKYSIMFETSTESAELKVWWVHAGSNNSEPARPLVVLDESGSVIYKDDTAKTYGQLVISTFTLEKAGKYYLGGSGGKNWLFKVEVTESPSGGTVVPTPDPPDPTEPDKNAGLNKEYLKGGVMLPFGRQVPLPSTISSYNVRFGAVAGILDSATVTNSGAYVDYTGYDTTTHYSTQPDAYDYYIVKNAIVGKEDTVGGFAGNVTGSDISGSFAAVKVQGVKIAGGFAGKLTSGTKAGDKATTINNCYVGGHTYQGTYLKVTTTAGKQTGEGVVNISTTDKYKQTFTGGFVGQIQNTVQFSGINYTTASVGMAENTYLSSNKTSTMGRFSGDGDVKVVETADENLVYATGETFRNKEYFAPGDKAELSGSEEHSLVRDEKYLDDTALVRDPKNLSADVYDNVSLVDKGYPYVTASTQEEHHGDWTERYNFIYFEVYDETYTGDNIENIKTLTDPNEVKKAIGFYATLRDTSTSGTGGTRLVNTLHQEGEVLDSGYMILTDSNVGSVTFTITSRYGGGGSKRQDGKETYITTEDRIDNSAASSQAFQDQIDNPIADYLYIVPFNEVNLAPSDTYYQKVTINGQPYMLNQYFACEAINVGLAVKGTDGKWVMDYETVRVKEELEYEEIVYDNAGKMSKSVKTLDTKKDDNNNGQVIIRSPWNFASMVRFTRMGNTSDFRDKARTLTYAMLMDVDYKEYVEGRVYDGNDHNRTTVRTNKKYDRAGSSYIYGQSPAVLNGGKFDGHGHTLSNLYLSNDTALNFYVGIFSGLDNGATVKNLKVVNLYINSGVSVKKYDDGTDEGKPYYDEKDSTEEKEKRHIRYTYMGGIAAQVMGNSTIENVSLNHVVFDMHAIPTYSEKEKVWDWRWPEENDQKALAPIRSVGGAVGLLIDGTVRNVTIDGLNINLDGEKHQYETDKGDEFGIREVTSGGTKSYSVVRDDVDIYVGGAIGSIEPYAYGHAMDVTVKNDTKGSDTTEKPQNPSEKTKGGVLVEDVYVTDPTIKATRGTGNQVGGLVGRADGKKEEDGFDSAKRNISIRYSGVRLEKVVDGTTDNFNTVYGVLDTSSKKSTAVGGFVGRSDQYVTLSNCFSAIRVEGSGEVGGFAGHIEGSVIESCYSGGHTVNKEYKVGADDIINVTANKSGSIAGGFAGKIESGDGLQLSGTIYTTSSVTNNDTGATDNLGLFQGAKSNIDSLQKVVDKAAGSVTLYAAGRVPSGKTALDESAYLLTGASLPSGTGTETHAYDEKLKDEAFPYLNSTDTNTKGNDSARKHAHYGDWADYTANGFFNWELENGAYHFYVVMKDNTGNVTGYNDLCTVRHEDGQVITDWGYGVFSSTLSEDDLRTALTNASFTEDMGSAGAMEAFKAKFATAKGVVMFTGSGSKTVTLGTDDFTVNPAYAAAIESGARATLGTSDETPYQVRTMEQFSNIGESEGVFFQQTHDISGKSATYKPNSLTNGGYDGQSYRILDLNIEATGSDSAALFSALTDSNVSNTILYATSGTGEITGEKAAGIAVSMNGGSITNSIVAGYTVSGKTIGGLVAETSGNVTIENSQATVSRSITGAGGNIGGLVGYVKDGTLTVKESYAGGEVVTAKDVELKSDKTSIGGIVGARHDPENNTDKFVTYDTVYSYVAMAKDELKFKDDKVKDENGKDTSDFEYVTFYGIGPDVDIAQTDSIGYWSGGVLDPNTDDRALGTALANLTKWKGANHTAEHVYMPNPKNHAEVTKDATALTDIVEEYPFIYGEYVKDAQGDKENIHYGDWPVAEAYAGLFNWELERVTDSTPGSTPRDEYHFYAYGVELVRGKLFESVLLDNLCKDHHVNERATILQSGYGYFLPNGSIGADGIKFSFDVRDGEVSVEDKFTFDDEGISIETKLTEIKNALFDNAKGNLNAAKEDYKIHILFDERNAETKTETDSADPSKEIITKYGIDKFADVKNLKWQITATPTSGTAQSFDMRVYPTFGEAIYGDDFDMNEGNDNDTANAEPMQVRTRQQFERLKANADDKSIDYIVLSHDIDFAEEDAAGYAAGVIKTDFVDNTSNYVPGQLRTKIFDGQGYRLFDVKIKVTGTKESVKYTENTEKHKTYEIQYFNNPHGDAALFLNNRDSETTKIRNLVLYSPTNEGLIETTVEDGYAAGIIARAEENYLSCNDGDEKKTNNRFEIDNVVVAGYTIKGSGAVGGIVGTAVNNSSVKDEKMDNCQVVANLVGTKADTFIGGLAAKWNTEITNCYTGGSVSLEGVTATDKTVIGGIVGEGDNQNITSCYTYMDFNDLADATDAKIYAFGSKVKETDKDKDLYYEANATDVTFAAAQGKEATYGDLCDDSTGKEYSYWPKAKADGCGYEANAMGTFPFRMVSSFTEDGKTFNVHYGDWPEGTHATGLAYYEQYEDGSFGVQVLGLKKDGDEVSESTLCEDYHTDTSGNIVEHRIVASGYAAFTTDADLTAPEITGLGDATTDNALESGVRSAIGAAIGGSVPKDNVQVYPTGKGGDVRDHTVTVNGTTSKTIHYTNGFAGVSENAFGTTTNAYQIRTVRQLDNIPQYADKYFEQAHDLYGKDKDGREYSEINGGEYTGASEFKGTYDGNHYRILELSIRNSSPTDYGVGLFSKAEGIIRNVIMYSPSGKAVITNTLTNSSAYCGTGGIVGISVGKGTLVVDNCIVAGYTISGKQVVGGIVGYSSHGGTIKNCEAVNTLILDTTVKSTDQAIGGITGACDINTSDYPFSMDNCYAGGKIEKATDKTVVGGLIGSNFGTSGKPTVKNSYSYVDLTSITGAKEENINTIGGGLSADSKDNYYLSDRVPDDLETSNKQGNAVNFVELNKVTDDNKGSAGHAYNPDNGEGLSDTTYFFPAVVKDKNNNFVHYGEMPPLPSDIAGAVNGIFYYEKHGNEYDVQMIGVDKDGTEVTEKSEYSLCKDRDGIGISESGFGYFVLDGKVNIGTNHGAEITYSAEIAGIRTALGVHDLVQVHAFKNGTTAKDEEWSFTANGKTYSRHVNPANAKLTDEAVDNEYEIRSYSQLMLMNLVSEKENVKITLAHDIDASASSGTDAEFKYTPATMGEKGSFDGKGFRILELSISTDGKEDHAALFGTTKKSATISNVVMFSSKGAKITATGDSAYAAGIVGKPHDSGNCIENCVVAGFTIQAGTGSNAYAGGIVDNQNKAIISKCEAVNKFDANNQSGAVGGIAGQGNGTIEYCYAGGSVTNVNVSSEKLNTYVGGIYGKDNSAKPKNCYSYMDLINLNATITNYNERLSAIGQKYSGTDCYYLEEKFPTSGNNVNKAGTALTTSVTLSGFDTASVSYAPEESSMTGGVTGKGMTAMDEKFPYPAIFTHDGSYEHYGTWLDSSTGAGAPGIPEGPSFEAAVLPEGFRLPEVEDRRDPDADGHTRFITLNPYAARLYRMKG